MYFTQESENVLCFNHNTCILVLLIYFEIILKGLAIRKTG